MTLTEYNPDGLEFGDHVPEKLDKSPIRHRQVISPPIPVVQKKLIEKSLGISHNSVAEKYSSFL